MIITRLVDCCPGQPFSTILYDLNKRGSQLSFLISVHPRNYVGATCALLTKLIRYFEINTDIERLYINKLRQDTHKTETVLLL